MRNMYLRILCCAVLGVALTAKSQQTGIVWHFDENSGATVHDAASGVDDSIEGYFLRVPGVSGKALSFDGYTTAIERPADKVPQPGRSFTVSAWVALDDYPWNWVPIVDRELDDQVGYVLEIDAFGHPGFGIDVNGVWQHLTSPQRLPLKKWSRVTATFDSHWGITIYINGRPAGSLKTSGSFFPAEDSSLIVGRVRTATLPFPSWLIHPHDAVFYSIEGYLDDVSVLPGARSASEEAADFENAHVTTDDVIPYAVMPSGPHGAGPFGAFYATLKFKPSWDNLRRFGPNSDVVVRFEQSPIRLVFWEGLNYMPAWVTENGKWYNEQSLETWGRPYCTGGEDCEPMSDKQDRSSRVSIIESTPARAVVRWRYALVETRAYAEADPDPDTGWGDWVEEQWTVYPDGIAVRKQTLWHTSPDTKDYEWQETIDLHNPGNRPEDDIQPDALTLANMNGEIHTYHWIPKVTSSFDYPRGPKKLDLPANANIQLVNLKSNYKPFEVVNPAGGVTWHVYGGERSYSMFEWWNHWPVSQIASSGRPAMAADRPSHTSLTDIYWSDYKKTPHTETKILMTGLTADGPAHLVTIAKSWLSPAPASAVGSGVSSVDYDPTQRAYIVHRTAGSPESPITITLNASNSSPLVNPAFIIENWNGKAKARILGHSNADASIRMGVSQTLDSQSLVVWCPLADGGKVQVRIEPLSSATQAKCNRRATCQM